MAWSGADVVIEACRRADVEYVFGLPGGAVMPIFDSILDSKIKLILTRHEQGATHMADGYARATGKPGVVLVTSGPGATNTVTRFRVCSNSQASSSLGRETSMRTRSVTRTRPTAPSRTPTTTRRARR